MAAALLARNAVRAGLRTKPWVKTTVSPGLPRRHDPTWGRDHDGHTGVPPPGGQRVTGRDRNTYASRRGNHEVMMRGAFANVRLRHAGAPDARGSRTRDFTRAIPETATVQSDGRAFTARLRLDTPREVDYVRHGGVMPYVVRRFLQDASARR